jgi:hypothetical protein
MRSYQHTAFAVFERYDVLYGTDETDTGVGLGRRRRFLYLYRFSFSTTFLIVLVMDLRDSFVFSLVPTVMVFERIW